MMKVFVPKDEIRSYPKGWNEGDESIIIIYAYEEINEKEITSTEIAKLAQEGGSFNFLFDSQEDIYSIKNGEDVK